MIKITKDNFKKYIGETAYASKGLQIKVYGFWDGKTQVEVTKGLYIGFDANILTLEDCF